MSALRNLILVHTEGWQDVRDFETIKAHVETLAPDIEVFIAANSARSSYTRKKAAHRPTLIFSPTRLLEFEPLRGKLYAGRPMSKLDEMQALVAGGMRVPRFEEVRPQTRLTRADYGPFTIVKSSYAFASWGQGIELRLTENVRYRAPEDYPIDHPGRRAPMVAQSFIDCGFAMSCRVLTLFGTPIFSYCRVATRPLALAGRGEPFAMGDFLPTPPDTDAYVTHDPEILAFATKAYGALPDVPLQACDILRGKDGTLYLLEVNPGGGTWMFSSPHAHGYRSRLGLDDLSSAFDSFRVCAEVLIARTRTEAV